MSTKAEQLTEISRSFTLKYFPRAYESRDFFCARKEECRVEDAEDVSERLFAFCKREVMKSLREYKAKLKQE